MKHFGNCLLTACLALVSSSALAIDRVAGTQTYYSASSDPMTDINTSVILISEVNDTEGNTVLAVRCSSFDTAEVWASLSTKHQLLSADDAAAKVMPAVTIRLGSDAPVVLPGSQLTSVLAANREARTDAVALSGTSVRTIVDGLNAGKRLVVRVNRASGGQPLTYTFSASGFATAWNAVNRCAPNRTATPGVSLTTPSPGANSGPAPKFTKWYFTTCRDAATGSVRTGLVAGRAHLCELVIETLPNGAQPVSASFQYELEYREGNRTGKLVLDAVDRWSPAGGTPIKYRMAGNALVFTLPLNVNVRPNRVYFSINVTATVNFSNGSSKKVYEPLPVKPPF